MSAPGEAADSHGVYLPEPQISRLAIFSAVGSFICVLPGTGLVGLLFGLIALRQIGSSRGTLGGANLAWVGILGGLFSSLGWAAVGQRYVQVAHQLDAPTSAFLTAWSKSEVDGEAAAAPGLRPMMRGGPGDLLRGALHDRFGDFKGLDPRTHFRFRPRFGADEISATFPLRFQSGAPCQGTFDYARNHGQLEVVGVEIDSPLLRDLALVHRNSLRGAATPDLRDFDPADPKGSRQVKSYDP